MCLILDASKFGDFIDPDNSDMAPVKEWIKKSGKIVYSQTTELEKELNKCPKMKEYFEVQRKVNKLNSVNKEKVEKKEKSLKNLSSDDPHIIALALVSGTRLLVSGDKNLHKDFKNIVQGNVYQNKKHKRLLKQDICP